MAQLANTYDRYDLKGDREDLIDKIFNTAPTETPVVSSFGRTKASNTLHVWQRDALTAANANNALIDGDEFSASAITATSRVGNYCQTFGKQPLVTRRANIIKKAGRASEMGYQKAKAMLEIKRDIEAMVLSTNVAVAGNSTTAMKSGGLAIQLYTNALHNGAGATPSHTSGAPTAAITAGTARTFTEALLKTACQNIYVSSGTVAPMVVMSPSHKTLFSAFAGIAVNRFQVGKKEQGRIIGGADVYMSDFGELEIVPHYLMVGATNVYLLNSDYGELAFFDGFRTEALGKSGDSEKNLITADVTLAVRAETAMGKIADLTA